MNKKAQIKFIVLGVFIILSLIGIIIASGEIGEFDGGGVKKEINQIRDFNGDLVNANEPYIWKIEPSVITYKNYKTGEYTKTLLSGTQYVEDTDGKWKHIENATSLKNSNIKPKFIETDPNYEVEIIDYNLTSIKYNLKIKDDEKNKDIQVRVWDVNKSLKSEKVNEKTAVIDDKGKNKTKEWKDEKDIELGYKEYSKKTEDKFVKQLENSKEYTQEFGLGKILEIGPNSTTITLQDADTENLKDSYTNTRQVTGDFSDTNYGTSTSLYLVNRVGNPEGSTIIFLQFNLSGIQGLVNSANVSLYLYGPGIDSSENYEIYHVYNDWSSTGSPIGILNETQITYNNNPCGQTWSAPTNNTFCNLTMEDGIENDGLLGWHNWSIKNAVQTSLSNNKVSLALYNDGSGSGLVLTRFYSKEYGTASLHPKLTITYTPYIDINSPSPAQTFTEDSGYTLFNITNNTAFSTCYAELDSATNFTLTNSGSSWSLENSSMIDGSHSVKYWCNESSTGTWRESDTVSFYVDSVNVTTCRNLIVSRTYELQNDIYSEDSSSSYCINIDNDNILLNGNNHLITFNISDENFPLSGIINSGNNSNITNIRVNTINYYFTLYGSGDCSNGIRFPANVDNYLYNLQADSTPCDNNLYLAASSATVYSINSTGSEDFESGGSFHRKWYFDYKVNSSSGNINGASVEIYDKDGSLVFNPTTNSSGQIPQQILTEYINNGGTKTYSSPYTVNVSKTGYITNSTVYNLTTLQNVNTFVTLELANVAPVSTLSSPTDNIWSQNLANDYTCIQTDSDANLKNATLYLWKGVTTLTKTNNVTGSSNSTTFSSEAVTEQGTWLWNCLVYDEGGLSDWANSNRTINIDTTDPTISYGTNTELNNTNFSRNWVYVNTTWTETNFNNITFYLYNSTGLRTSSTYTSATYLQNFTSLPDGVYYYNVTIRDKSGRSTSTETRKITLDNQNPSILYNQNTQSSGWLNKDYIFVNITASDTNKNSVWLTWQGSNETFDNSDGNIYWENKTGLSDGTYTFLSGINDSAGNTNTTSQRTVNVDTTFPLIDWSLGVELNNTNHSKSNIFFNTTLTETNCNQTAFYWKISSGSWQSYNSSSCETSYNKTSLIDGIYEYYVFVKDHAGNQNQTEIRTIRLDDTTPTLNILFPEDLDVYNYHNQTLNFSVSDNLVGLDTCWKNLNGDGNVTIDCSLNSTVNSSLGGTIEGTNTLEMWANDTLGNLVYSSISFGVSTTSPAIILDFPPTSVWLDYGDNLYLNYTATDADGLDTCELWGNFTGAWALNYSNSGVTSGVQDFTTINVSDGNYKWNVWCNDTLGNGDFSPTNKTFNVDTIYPLIEYSTGTEDNNVNLTQDFIYINISITELNFKNITFYLYTDAEEVNSTTYTSLTNNINFTSLPNGEYFYQVNITDQAGNKNFTELREINLDNQNPSVTVLTPENNTYNSTTSQNFTANFTDNLGIKNTTLYIYNESGLENETNFEFEDDTTISERGIVVNLLEGMKTWFYKTWDWAGNLFTSGNSTITIDTTEPLVIDGGYYPDTIYTETEITIYGNITDTNLNDVWIEINSTGTYQNITVTTQNGEGQFIYPLTSSETSNHDNISWRWWADDLAGNENSSELNSFIITNRNPYNLTVLNFTNDSYINTNWKLINFSANDEDNDTLNYSVYYSNDSLTYELFNSTEDNFINLTGFNFTNEARNWFYVLVSDGYLTNESSNYSFRIDNEIPNLTINSPLASPVIQCSLSDVLLNLTVSDTNLDYCTLNITSGSDISTAHTIFNCSNTNFDVTFDNSVQLMTVGAFDSSGNSNITQRYIYFNSGHSSCAVSPPGGGGGGGSVTPPQEEQPDLGFCGDNICQDGKNGTINRGEDFYNCAIDCSIQLSLTDINLDTVLLNCFNEETRDQCIWVTRPGLWVIFVSLIAIFLFAFFFSIKTDKKRVKIVYTPIKSRRRRR
jgi:hypothetical protein